MSGHRILSEVLRKEPRIDSGTALSDPVVTSSGQFSAKKVHMPELRNTKYDFGVAKAQYGENELKLRQPEGFPIIPLPITIARAYEEAAMAAAARDHSELVFDIYEDVNDGTRKTTAEEDHEMVDAYTSGTVGEEEEQGNNSDEARQVGDENHHGVPPNSTNATKIDPRLDVHVDSLGRTRAAAHRRKALETIQLGDHAGDLTGDVIIIGSNKKRTSSRIQKPTQPRRQSVRRSR
ncbi:hypothetical protein COCMIDRAFT_96700 [Bipolaris oryzae ATCC 44560]|uniref:Uncharacterized protein n=1 Tax=Bipolaris oryzae ATCC 44560 TaxID=930090 RepID=W6Z041_COCMI|nr:uncharacterized protein COCMIDRAFT_96700 [Bipolaris oryzae ATCC 44560]EUC45002.1 hypothetical protein COCMIDRAFT_96700 [Bipolaris oryzae ATCC 44560]